MIKHFWPHVQLIVMALYNENVCSITSSEHYLALSITQLPHTAQLVASDGAHTLWYTCNLIEYAIVIPDHNQSQPELIYLSHISKWEQVALSGNHQG